MPRFREMRKYRDEERLWQQEFNTAAPKMGEIAPDFELRDVNGENTVRLSDFHGVKPVALLFGSFT